MEFTNFIEFIKQFPTNETCKEQLEQIRWNGMIVCPHCDSDRKYILQHDKGYQCKDCRKQYNVFTKTIFENTKIELRLWFITIYLVSNHKKGISSHQLARDMGLTQKTSWFMLNRVREALNSGQPFFVQPSQENPVKTVEIDESYFGGRAANMHNAKRKVFRLNGTGYVNKTMVFGMLERGGEVRNFVVNSVMGPTLKPMIRDMIAPGMTIVTDNFGAYSGLNGDYSHQIVNHTAKEYVRGAYHTNTLEGYWSLIKRGIYGIYHHASAKHMQRYCDEFTYRYNTRLQGEGERFNNVLYRTVNKRLKYKELIA